MAKKRPVRKQSANPQATRAVKITNRVCWAVFAVILVWALVARTPTVIRLLPLAFLLALVVSLVGIALTTKGQSGDS